MKSALVRTVCGYRIRQVGGIPFDDLQEAQAGPPVEAPVLRPGIEK